MVQKNSKQKQVETKRQIILFDNDDFYGLTLDMVLFNLGQDNSIKVITKRDYDNFVKELNNGKFENAIFLIDENYAWGKVDMEKLLDEIKKKDKGAILICYSVSDENGDEIANKDKYDHVVMKTGLDNEKTLIQTLSQIFGVEFVMDNSDPEYTHS